MQNIYKISRIKSQQRPYQGFYEQAVTSLEMLSKVICTTNWSPILFKDGIRAIKNYERARFIGLDFDKGMCLPEAIETFKKYTHIIGTTRSHQKEKVSASGLVEPACDRFRVVLACENWCENFYDYTFTMCDIMKVLPNDKSCKDAARLFFPCKEIVSLGKGEKYPWLKEPPKYAEQRAKRKERESKTFLANQGEGIIPPWLREELKSTHLYPSRHTRCYRLGAELMKQGYSLERTIDIVFSNPSLRDIQGVEDGDGERSVACGWNKAREDIYEGLED
jgi:hypothetical protein